MDATIPIFALFPPAPKNKRSKLVSDLSRACTNFQVLCTLYSAHVRFPFSPMKKVQHARNTYLRYDTNHVPPISCLGRFFGSLSFPNIFNDLLLKNKVTQMRIHSGSLNYRNLFPLFPSVWDRDSSVAIPYLPKENRIRVCLVNNHYLKIITKALEVV